MLGPNATDEQKAELKKQLDATLAAAKHQVDVTNAGHIYDNGAGFARTDALARIGNQVFAADANIDANYAIANAPVRFPQIWDASWFNWVRYARRSPIRWRATSVRRSAFARSSSCSGPMRRAPRTASTCAACGRLEDLLAGPRPLQGLASPKWPSVFPVLDQGKVSARRRALRAALPAVSPATARATAHRSRDPRLRQELRAEMYWWKSANGSWVLKVSDVELDYVGTDPRQATDFKRRTASTGDLGKGVVSAAVGLIS